MIDLKMSIMGSFVLYQTISTDQSSPEENQCKSIIISAIVCWVTELVGWVDNYGGWVIVIWFVRYWLSLYYHINIPCRSTPQKFSRCYEYQRLFIFYRKHFDWQHLYSGLFGAVLLGQDWSVRPNSELNFRNNFVLHRAVQSNLFRYG